MKGIAEKPVYIRIDDGNVEIKEASHLWGKTTIETENILKNEYADQKIAVALIGPAGEMGSHIASVMHDGHRAAGRGGTGGVMGSKKLKAIVVGGKQRIPVADREALTKVNKTILDFINSCPIPSLAGLLDGYKKYGTSISCMPSVLIDDTGIKNWTGCSLRDYPEQMAVKVDIPTHDEMYNIKRYGCSTCPLRCGAYYKSESERWPVEHTSRPEYETWGNFGPLLLNTDLECIIKCNHMCNEYGLDTISAGATVAWAMECYNRGIFSKEELDGIDLSWGNADAIVKFTEIMCKGIGFGSLAIHGSKYAADKTGKGHECLVVASGIEQPARDGRIAPGMCRTYQYDPTPGRHVKGGLGLLQANMPPKLKYVYKDTGYDDMLDIANTEMVNNSGLCAFSNFACPPGAKWDMLNAVTGYDFSFKDIVETGLRSFNMRHVFNLREGLTRKDFTLCERSYIGAEAGTEGPHSGVVVDKEALADNLFAVLGWNSKMIPHKVMLEMLGGLDNAVADLYPEDT